MFRAMTVRRFMSMSCVVRYRLRSMLEASTTLMTTSGMVSSRFLRTYSSSGE